MGDNMGMLACIIEAINKCTLIDGSIDRKLLPYRVRAEIMSYLDNVFLHCIEESEQIPDSFLIELWECIFKEC